MKKTLCMALVLMLALFGVACAEREPAIDPYTLAETKMAQPGAITSDVVAGIDQSSVTVQGDITLFTAVMSDGAALRFEGQNILISDEGLTMNPGSSVTSLDAVGQIYRYDARIRDREQSPICDQWLDVGYGYTFSAQKTSVKQSGDVYTFTLTGLPAVLWGDEAYVSTAYYDPNFVYFSAPEYNTDSFTLTSLTIGYNPAQKVTALVAAELDTGRYGLYTEGAPYNASKEDKADATIGLYDFYLMLRPEPQAEAGVEEKSNWLGFLPSAFYEVGALRNADGQEKDKFTARVHAGDTLDVTIGDYQLAVELPVVEPYTQAQTLREARPYSTLSAVGRQHALVVPVVWADQTELISDEVYALYQQALGSAIDQQGNPMGDFSDGEDKVFSLSEYFATASYGQLEISSFLTDWYYTDKVFANDYEYAFPEVAFAQEVLNWVKATYPDTDWTQFDQDGDGCVDALVLLSVGLTQNEGYMPGSFGGAVHSTGNQFGELAGTQLDPNANCFVTVNHSLLMNGNTHTLIHEFSHNFGLNDYYDGLGYGISPVGGYDMQGDSVGDWNAYSKLAVGWMQPQVVTGLQSGESVELTIGSSALQGDVILLPAAGTEYAGPFGEYVMIDLLTPDGANAYDAAQYGLADTVGVRISHVNATLRPATQGDGMIGYTGPEDIVIGMEIYGSSYQAGNCGFYNVEVIQADGLNTFTEIDQLYPLLQADDLFQQGDTFAAENYDQFFYQGLMDNGLPLGYTVQIASIGTDADGQPAATIRITAQ